MQKQKKSTKDNYLRLKNNNQMTTILKERRKRLGNQLRLTLVGVFLIVEPFLQVVVLFGYHRDIAIIDIFRKMNWIQIALWITPVVCGIGLFQLAMYNFPLIKAQPGTTTPGTTTPTTPVIVSPVNGNQVFTNQVEGMVFVHSDHLGSVTMLTDASIKLSTSGRGVVLTGGSSPGKSHISYKPYGEIHRTDSAGPDIVKYKYAGQEEDRETGLYYYKARYYDAALGRFITPDSMDFKSEPMGMNRYMYVSGNPVRFTDPTGHSKSANKWLGSYIGYMNAQSLGLSPEQGALIGYGLGSGRKSIRNAAKWVTKGWDNAAKTFNNLSGQTKYDDGDDLSRSDLGRSDFGSKVWDKVAAYHKDFLKDPAGTINTAITVTWRDININLGLKSLWKRTGIDHFKYHRTTTYNQDWQTEMKIRIATHLWAKICYETGEGSSQCQLAQIAFRKFKAREISKWKNPNENLEKDFIFYKRDFEYFTESRGPHNYCNLEENRTKEQCYK